MREQKKHWVGGQTVFNLRVALCGLVLPSFANAKKNVTCKNCLRAMGEKV